MFGGAVGPLIQAHASELFNHYSTEGGDAPYSRNQSLPVILANLAALAAVLSLIKFNRQAASAGGGVYIVGSLIVSHPGAGHTKDDVFVKECGRRTRRRWLPCMHDFLSGSWNDQDLMFCGI